jgi:hypothetical protein
MSACPPEVEGGDGDALAVAEVSDGQATASEVFEPLLPALAGVGIGTAAGSGRDKHEELSQKKGQPTSLLDLSIT